MPVEKIPSKQPLNKPQPRKQIKHWFLTSSELDALLPHAQRLWDEYRSATIHPLNEQNIARAKSLKMYLDQLPASSVDQFFQLKFPHPIKQDVIMLYFGGYFLKKRKKSSIPFWIYPVIDIMRRELAGQILWKILSQCTNPTVLNKRLAGCNEQIGTIFIPLDSAIKLAQKLLSAPAKFAALKSGLRKYRIEKGRPSR